MKISVLIIAYNEEKYIAKCIESILNQSQKPDEIVLIVHNCTDKTIEIAQKYPITIVPFSEPEGIAYARIKGLESISGDVVLCIDGDSFAEENWIEIMVKTLESGNILVGSWVKFRGALIRNLANFFDKYLCVRNKTIANWIWGSSFAFWGKDKEFVKNIYEKSIKFSQQLQLSRNPDDFWLALFMKQQGKLAVTNKTHMTLHLKEKNSIQVIKRHIENIKNGNKIEKFFNKNNQIS